LSARAREPNQEKFLTFNMVEQEEKNLSSTLVGALQAKGLTAEKLAEATGVSERFLESLIEDKPESLPPLPYVRGYLMRVADVLSLDGDELFEEYLKGNRAVKRSGKYDRLPENRFKKSKSISRLIIPLLAILGILLYVILRTPLFAGTDGFVIKNLDEGITYADEPVFMVAGELGDSRRLTLNGERVYPDERGNFTARIELEAGFNTLVFNVKKFLGKEKTVTKQIFYIKDAEEEGQ
jgi:transcriptional regulator with XRE-family HTH domain